MTCRLIALALGLLLALSPGVEAQQIPWQGIGQRFSPQALPAPVQPSKTERNQWYGPQIWQGNNTSSGSNLWLGPNSQPLCTLTDAATILVAAGPSCSSDATKGVAYDGVTLTANGHIFGCPTGATSSGSGILIRVNEGAGPYKVSPSGCYYFPPAAIDSQGNIILSGIANGINQFYCELEGTSTGNGFPVQYECYAPVTGLGSATVYVANTPVENGGCTGPTTTCTVQVNITSGDILAIFAQDCGTSNGCTGSAVSVSSASGTGLSGCTKFTGAEGFGNGLGAHWLYCTVTATTTPTTVTVTYASNANFISLVAVDLHNAATSPDEGIGNTCTGTTSSLSCATNGNNQQSNGFILSGAVPLNNTSITPGGNPIIVSSGAATLVQYQLAYAPGATATATATAPGTTAYEMSTVGVLHR